MASGSAPAGNPGPWQTFTPGVDRILGTTYTNSAANDRHVIVRVTTSTGTTCGITVNGIGIASIGASTSAEWFFTVPAGASYVISTNGSPNVSYWSERL